jgi:hypothetical protein
MLTGIAARASSGRAASLPSQYQVGPVPRSRNLRTTDLWSVLSQYGVLRLRRLQISPTPGWPRSRGSLQAPEVRMSTGA